MGMGLIRCCHTGEYNRRFVGAIRMREADYARGMVGLVPSGSVRLVLKPANKPSQAVLL